MERFKSWYIHPQLEQVLLEGKNLSILTKDLSFHFKSRLKIFFKKNRFFFDGYLYVKYLYEKNYKTNRIRFNKNC
jgi:hypothetical protein